MYLLRPPLLLSPKSIIYERRRFGFRALLVGFSSKARWVDVVLQNEMHRGDIMMIVIKKIQTIENRHAHATDPHHTHKHIQAAECWPHVGHPSLVCFDDDRAAPIATCSNDESYQAKLYSSIRSSFPIIHASFFSSIHSSPFFWLRSARVNKWLDSNHSCHISIDILCLLYSYGDDATARESLLFIYKWCLNACTSTLRAQLQFDGCAFKLIGRMRRVIRYIHHPSPYCLYC